MSAAINYKLRRRWRHVEAQPDRGPSNPDRLTRPSRRSVGRSRGATLTERAPITTSPNRRPLRHLPPAVGLTVLPAIAAKNPGEVWFNPGADAPEVLAEARRLGLNVIAGCSIVNLGMSPAQFPDS